MSEFPKMRPVDHVEARPERHWGREIASWLVGGATGIALIEAGPPWWMWITVIMAMALAFEAGVRILSRYSLPRHTPLPLRFALWLATTAVAAAATMAFVAFLERIPHGLEIGDFVVGAVVAVALALYLLVVLATCQGHRWARLTLTVTALLTTTALLALLAAGTMPFSLFATAAAAGSLPLVSVALMWLPAGLGTVKRAV